MAAVFECIAILGAGLIGGSIALATRESGAADAVNLFDADVDVRKRVRELNMGEVHDTAIDAVRNADLVVLAVPVGAMAPAFADAAPALKQGAIVTDVGSVKRAVIEAILASLPPHAFLIPGHPI